jgi:hypothetical protein
MDDDDYVPSHLRKPPPVDGTVFAAINNNITAIFAHIYLDQYYRCGFKDQIAIMKAIELCPNLHIRNQLWRKVAGWIFGLSAAKAWIRWRELKTDLTKHGWVRLSLGYGPRWLGFLLDRQLTGMHVIDHYHLTPSIRWSGAIKLHEKFGWRHADVAFAVVDEYLFTLVVFYADGLLRLGQVYPPNMCFANPHLTLESEGYTRRFFRITAQLPLDLQMVLCNRAMGSIRNVITSAMSEPAFRALAAFY